MKELVVPIDANDINILKSINKGRAWRGSPSCPCGGVELVFKSKDKEVVIYPAGDGCTTMRIEKGNTDYFFHLKDDDNLTLKRILGDYGVSYPFGI